MTGPPLDDMLESQPHTGLALLCDGEGVITHIIRDDLGMDRGIVGRLFTLLVDRGSMGKALSFLAEVREKGAAFNWELNIPVQGDLHTLHVAGSRIGQQLLIVAATNGQEMMALYEEMMRIGNEQVNALRNALKAQSAATQRSAARDDELYDQISQLNNELTMMQRELARKNMELERLNALKNQFLGMAAHDLRNPLNTIYGYAEFLRAGRLEQLSPEEREEFVEIILSSSRFMADLVNDLLDVARIESGKVNLELDVLDLVALAQRNVQINRALAADKDIALELQFSPEELPALVADPGKIEQVLNNLITNAVKFSHPGSRVLVTLQAIEDSVLIRVSDEGEGMTAEQKERLFRPFEVGRARGTAGEKGTGLGMVIVRKIVEGHGGTIEVESEPGAGSTFTIRLPLQADG